VEQARWLADTVVRRLLPDDWSAGDVSQPFRVQGPQMIMVVGGSGELGARVVRLLVEHGHEVRCLVRPKTDDAALRRFGATVVRGDLTEPPSLPAACDGIDTVVATVTAMGRRLGGVGRGSIGEVDVVGMSALVDAAEQARVRRFVFVSSAGLDRSRGTPFERAKIAHEQRLRASSMRAVLVRPDAFQETHFTPSGRFDMERGRVIVFGKGHARTRWVSADDVAALIAAVAVEPDAPELIEFGGPEPMSRNEAITIAEGLTGRPIKRQRVPRPILRLGMHLLSRPNDALASFLGLALMRDLADSSWDDTPLREWGIAPRSASDFLIERARNLNSARDR
jgi:uncharacterized protein YbjT (DUF2867 family)